MLGAILYTIAFLAYAAFNAASLHAPADGWEQSDDIAMDNPVGGIVLGRAAVRQVYAKLVQRPATERARGNHSGTRSHRCRSPALH